jgi:hypothetical protein
LNTLLSLEAVAEQMVLAYLTKVVVELVVIDHQLLVNHPAVAQVLKLH